MPAATTAVMLDHVAALIGADAARRLARAFPGRRMYVPRQVQIGHPLADAIGADLAAKLADRYGGCRIDIPLGPAAASARNAEAIRAMAAEGRSTGAIAAMLGVSRRTVQRIKSTTPAG